MTCQTCQTDYIGRATSDCWRRTSQDDFISPVIYKDTYSFEIKKSFLNPWLGVTRNRGSKFLTTVVRDKGIRSDEDAPIS